MTWRIYRVFVIEGFITITCFVALATTVVPNTHHSIIMSSFPAELKATLGRSVQKISIVTRDSIYPTSGSHLLRLPSDVALQAATNCMAS